jgi:heat shock protein HslJ
MKNLLHTLAALLLLLTLVPACKTKPVGGKLDHTYWTLSSALSNGDSINPSADIRFSLFFSKDKLAGTAPCNSFFANYLAVDNKLTISQLGATKRMCENMNLENTWLGLLVQARHYSVFPDRLDIYAESGTLRFVPTPAEEVNKLKRWEAIQALEALFPSMQADTMLHLYPIRLVDNPGDYPFKGNLLDTNSYNLFDLARKSDWLNGGGEVLAVGRFEEFLICRVPGRYASSDLALFRIASDTLKHVETVAWAWCDEGWCNQQDAWLLDIDKDGNTDIVTRYALIDSRGKTKEERLEVRKQQADGTFVEDPRLQPKKYRFPMAHL